MIKLDRYDLLYKIAGNNTEKQDRIFNALIKGVENESQLGFINMYRQMNDVLSRCIPNAQGNPFYTGGFNPSTFFGANSTDAVDK